MCWSCSTNWIPLHTRNPLRSRLTHKIRKCQKMAKIPFSLASCEEFFEYFSLFFAFLQQRQWNARWRRYNSFALGRWLYCLPLSSPRKTNCWMWKPCDERELSNEMQIENFITIMSRQPLQYHTAAYKKWNENHQPTLDVIKHEKSSHLWPFFGESRSDSWYLERSRVSPWFIN